MQRTQGGMTGTGREAWFIRALLKVSRMPTGFQETEFLSVCALRILWELWVCIRPQTSFRVPLSATPGWHSGSQSPFLWDSRHL